MINAFYHLVVYKLNQKEKTTTLNVFFFVKYAILNVCA